MPTTKKEFKAHDAHFKTLLESDKLQYLRKAVKCCLGSTFYKFEEVLLSVIHQLASGGVEVVLEYTIPLMDTNRFRECIETTVDLWQWSKKEIEKASTFISGLAEV